MFKRAERKKAKARIALCGTSGSGKTYSAILIACGISEGKIAMLDTENGSGSLYADLCEYDVCDMSPPHTPQSYVRAIKDAEDAGYDTLIIDSLTHAWAGQGGALEMHDMVTASSRTGNSYTAWLKVTPHHNALVDAMLQSKMHIIATMRSKTAYDLIDDGNGKKRPVKIGLAPVQRDGMDYEFTTVFDMSVDKHVASASKDRTNLFDGETFIPDKETGSKIKSWLNTGAAIVKNETVIDYKPKDYTPEDARQESANDQQEPLPPTLYSDIWNAMESAATMKELDFAVTHADQQSEGHKRNLRDKYVLIKNQIVGKEANGYE